MLGAHHQRCAHQPEIRPLHLYEGGRRQPDQRVRRHAQRRYCPLRGQLYGWYCPLGHLRRRAGISAEREYLDEPVFLYEHLLPHNQFFKESQRAVRNLLFAELQQRRDRQFGQRRTCGRHL